MIPAQFDYLKPSTLTAACAAAAQPRAVVLAGGQSLLTELKQRRKRPQVVVDLAGVPGLDVITDEPRTLSVGAMVRQADFLAHPVVRSAFPVLAEAGFAAADPMVRRRGTLVGTCCEVAPAGDWVAASLVTDSTIVLSDGTEEREVPLTEFVTGPHTTSIRPGEIATALKLVKPTGVIRSAYRKVKHAAVGWSVAGCALALHEVRDDRCGSARIAVSGALTQPQRLTALEAELPDVELTSVGQLSQLVGDSLATLDFVGDYYASAEFRRRRLTTLLVRTLTELGSP
jgi:CO/xanthine dehydrogenase FAD-binding subunit